MKKMLRYTIPTIWMLSILLFCISAGASITEASTIVKQSILGPLKMLVLGTTFIGFGTFFRK